VTLRVGLLCHVGVGGSARVAMELAAALARRGHDVHVFARRAPLGMPRAPDGVALHALESGVNGSATPKLDIDWTPAELEALMARVITVAQGVNLDVLHFHYALPFAELLDAAARRLGSARPALVGTLHGTDVSVAGARSPTRERLSRALPRFDALTTVSASHAQLARATFDLPTEPEVIPNFVDVQRFRPAGRGPVRRRPRIVTVSNFRSVKQPLALARIFRAVRSRADAELWLVGDGDGMPRVLSLLHAAGLEADTRRFGLRLDVERILPQADLLLVTSRTESFCMAALEAAACGVPTVAPRVGGLPATVIDGLTGYLFGAGDESAAVESVIRLLSDVRVRERMAAQAIWHARRFSTDAVVPRYEELYRRVIASRSEARPMTASPAA
jgi:L-malate glycosyltransferase